MVYGVKDRLPSHSLRRSEQSISQSWNRRSLVKITASLFILFLLISLNLPNLAVSGQTIGDVANLSGVITSPDGPIEGITLTLNMDLEESFYPIDTVVTDAAGSYEFLDVPIGHPYLIEFNHGGVNHLRNFEVLSIVQVLDFNLSGTINFKINGLNGAPMDDIEVGLVSSVEFTVDSTLTDSTGLGNFTHLDLDSSYMITFKEAGVPYTEITDRIWGSPSTMSSSRRRKATLVYGKALHSLMSVTRSSTTVG
jgi:hypothetical protein